MKATELRIGNYLHDMAAGLVSVRGVTENGVWITDVAGPASVDSFSGIPLTEEWLQKFEFFKDISNDSQEREIYSIQVANSTSLYFDAHKDWMRDDMPVEWYLSHEWDNDHFKNDIGWSHPKSVHHLQNLYFALTGEELTLITEP